MDRFKFRAWIVEKQEMRYLVDGYNLCSTYVSPNLKPVLEIFPDVDNDRYIIGEECFLMGCTGLKDSEGKLIWEGDVVEIVLDDYNNQIPNAAYDDVVTPKVKNICEVRYRLHGGYVALVRSPARYKGNRLHLKNGRDKVLGNRFENPELLETVKNKVVRGE